MPLQILQSGSGTPRPRCSVSAKKLNPFYGKLTRVRFAFQKLLKAFPRSPLFRWCESDHQGVRAHDLLNNFIHPFPPKRLQRGRGTKVPREDLRTAASA
jgi:hypothetical protein